MEPDEALFKLAPFDLHRLESGPPAECRLSRADALHYYRRMLTARQMEAAIERLWNEGQIRGFCHQYVGQEACAVGICAIRQAEGNQVDAVVTSYRCHAWTHLVGTPVVEVIGELTGRSCGNAHGKGGSMHMFRPPHFYGAHGIVGAQIAIGAGIGLAMRNLGSPTVSFTVYGDGASNQGQFFESANMAALWRLPVVFVCENNRYGMGTAMERASASTEFFRRGGEAIPGIRACGQDVLSVREAARFARQWALDGRGPIILELQTYRFVGHGADDPETYRTKSEVKFEKERHDPIRMFREKILAAHLVDESALNEIDAQVDEEIAEAVRGADADAPLPPAALYTDLFVNSAPELIRGCTPDDRVRQPFRSTDELLAEQSRAAASAQNRTAAAV